MLAGNHVSVVLLAIPGLLPRHLEYYRVLFLRRCFRVTAAEDVAIVDVVLGEGGGTTGKGYDENGAEELLLFAMCPRLV